MNPQELQSRTIDVLRFPLSVMVVAIHTYFNESLNLRGTEISFSGVWAHELIRFFSIVLTDAAVPAFFVISGFLYFYKCAPDYKNVNLGGYIQKTKKKVMTLFVPYIIWNLTAIVIEPTLWHKPVEELLTGMWGIDGQGPWNGPLWFLRDLFVLMLFAPIIECVIRRTKLLLPIASLFLIIGDFAGDGIIRGLSYVGIAYFSLGAYIGIFYKDFIAILRRYRIVIISVYVLLMVVRLFSLTIFGKGGMELMTISVNKLVVSMYILSCIPAWAVIASYIGEYSKRMNIWKWLAGSSFVVYAMHRLFNSKVSALGLLILDKPEISGTEAVVLYFLTISITVVVCIGTYALLKRFAVTNILFLGARKR